MSDDKKIKDLVAFDAEKRADFKAVKEEGLQEQRAAFRKQMAKKKPKGV